MGNWQQSERWWRLLLCAGAVLAVVSPAVAEPDGVPAKWTFDVLHLKNGRSVQGLIVEETSSLIRFKDVRRKPGRPTVVFATTFAKNEVERLDKLDAKAREVLIARLNALDADEEREHEILEALALKSIPWGKNKTGGWSYSSDCFVLTSNADEDIVRQAAVRLENLYTAYTRLLPPRLEKGAATRIVLVSSQAEYQALLKDKGHNILNPAVYDAKHNQICCASELKQLGEELAQVRAQHKELLKELRDKEMELSRLYKGKIPASLVQELQQAHQRIRQANRKNEAVLAEATRRLYQALYHEAFHAYLNNFVYDPAETEVPRWLNEGLAQIFETAIVEAGELRVGHANEERLNRVKTAVRKGELVSVTDLLKAGPKHFAVPHGSDQQLADRYYLASWALAYYLTFDRRLLGSKRLDEFLAAVKRGQPPLTAFYDLVEQKSLPAFEEQFHRFLLQLQKDGSLAKPIDKR